jgi:hypothetical protein
MRIDAFLSIKNQDIINVLGTAGCLAKKTLRRPLLLFLNYRDSKVGI